MIGTEFVLRAGIRIMTLYILGFIMKGLWNVNKFYSIPCLYKSNCTPLHSTAFSDTLQNSVQCIIKTAQLQTYLPTGGSKYDTWPLYSGYI
jgi:hypothetical protein